MEARRIGPSYPYTQHAQRKETERHVARHHIYLPLTKGLLMEATGEAKSAKSADKAKPVDPNPTPRIAPEGQRSLYTPTTSPSPIPTPPRLTPISVH